MPCPLFLPASPLPLSDIYTGSCSADPHLHLSRELLTRACNPGYARATCLRADLAEADSVRFLVNADDGSVVKVMWATERNHHPIAVGTLCVGRSASPAANPLEAQAQSCAAEYLRRTGSL